MIGRALGLFVVVALLYVPTSPASAQNSDLVTKENALKNVRVSSLPGWVEAISEESSFRILFPGQPQINDDVISVKGLELTTSSGHWSASCSDLGRTVSNDESDLREIYEKSIKATVRVRTHLSSMRDVFLNGRLGKEFIVRDPRRVSYLRAFVSGHRLYTLSITRKTTATTRNVTIPAEVGQFFDSFTYWD